MCVNSTDKMGRPMPGFGLLVIFTAMTLSSRCPLLSQEPGFEATCLLELADWNSCWRLRRGASW